MKKTITLFVVCCFALHINFAFAQVGSLQIIDNSVASAGVTAFAAVDLDADGDNELIASFTGVNGCLAYYNNLGNGLFSERIILGEPAFARTMGIGFFNNDNLPDIIVGGGIVPELRLYINGSSWDSGTTVDNTFPTQINDMVVADFDNNGDDDFVVIGQHSIDFFRNDGDASFTKEEILTTQSSPQVLECLDIDLADVDNDDDMDLICGETAGVVVYFNDGNGIFTAHYYSPEPEIGIVVVPIDIDNDGHVDVFMKNSLDQLRWYRNAGDGTLDLEFTYADAHDLKAASTVDYNHDGFMDLFFTYHNHVAAWLNENGEGFSEEIVLHSNSNLAMGTVHIAQLDGINGDDLIWTGANNTIAYFPCNENITTSIPSIDVERSINVYPNPASDVLNIQFPETTVTKEIDVVDCFGRIVLSVKENTSFKRVNLASLASGRYTISLSYGGTQKIFIPFIKE